MTVVIASWGDGNLVTIVDGKVERASDEDARQDAERALARERVSTWTEGDRVEYFEQGQPGFVRAALQAIQGVSITGDLNNER